VFALREYTKKFEQQVLGTAADVRAQIQWPARGEFVLAIEGAAGGPSVERVPDEVADAIGALVASGASVAVVARALHGATGLPKKVLYAIAQAASDRLS
jgi:16S rRNA C1402 (ribose-2'-O) methylase RsmI